MKDHFTTKEEPIQFLTMRKSILLWAASLLLMTTPMKGQDNYNLPVITEPTPDAKALGKYGFFPVNKYTGTPSVQIPVHQFAFDGLAIPVQLSYHGGGGVKVMQEASWVGLGWTLTANAVITRQINGGDDLRVTDGYLNQPELPADFTTDFENYLEGNSQGSYDTQPDVFVANIFGQTLTFVLEKKAGTSGNEVGVRFLERNNSLVSYNHVDNTFSVIDDRGFRYHFGSVEESTTLSGGGTVFGSIEDEPCDSYNYDNSRDLLIPMSWHLDYIISPNGQQLDFSYLSVAGKDIQSISQSSLSQTKIQTVCANSSGTTGIKNDLQQACARNITKHKILKEISDQKGNRMVFHLGERSDLEDLPAGFVIPGHSNPGEGELPKKLEGIEVINSLGEVIKQVQFDYSYFNTAYLNTAEQELYVRLKLDKVTVQEKEYSFSYISPEQLPKKTSRDVDFWGYYNAANNQLRYPSYYVQQIGCQGTILQMDELHIPGGKRGSNAEAGKIGLLEKVTYPTGGSTSFVYESHMATLSNQSFDTEDKNTKDLILQNQVGNNGTQVDLSSGTTTQFMDYTVPAGESVVLWFGEEGNALLAMGCGYNCEDLHDYYSDRFFRITDLSDGSTMASYQYWFAAEHCDGYENGNPVGSCSRTIDIGTFTLQGGKTYRFTLDPINDTPGLPTVGFEASFEANLPEWPEVLNDKISLPVGGLRIKTVINKGKDGQITSTKAYRYEDASLGTPLSTGQLMNPLGYLSAQSRYNGIDTFYDLLLSSNSSIGIENSAQGSHIGYSYVDEIFTDNTIAATAEDVGSIRTTFVNLPNVTATAPGNPDLKLIYAPPFTFNGENGKPLNTATKDKNGQLARYTETDYQKTTLNNTVAYKLYYANRYTSIGGGQISYSDIIGYYRYYLPTISHTMTTETNREYDASGQAFETVSSYTYTDQDYLREKTTSSSMANTSQATQFSYPLDAPTEHSLLIANNRISMPIQTTVLEYQGNLPTVLQTTKIIYDNQYDAHGLLLPQEIQQSQGNEALETEISYDRYDAKGNILQYAKRDQIPITLIWSYEQQHIVAKLVNCTFAAAAQLLNMTEAELEELEVADLGLLDGLRNNNQPMQVTTYTYKPMVGMTSKTDPNGLTATYQYDAYGRLVSVTDPDGNSVQALHYQFTPQD